MSKFKVSKFRKQKSSSEKIQNENYSLTNSERKVSKTELKQNLKWNSSRNKKIVKWENLRESVE